MTRKRWINILLVLALAGLAVQLSIAAIRSWQNRPRPGAQVPASIHITTDSGNQRVRYLIYLPKRYSTEKRWPLLLFLHGSGQRGEDLTQVRKYGPPALIDAGRDLPFVVVSPQCRAGVRWDAKELLALLDAVESQFAIDADRVYVAGFSMGGSGSLELASRAPDRIAALIVVAGRGDLRDAHQLAAVAIWAFHGAEDDVVPMGPMNDLVERVREHGGDATLTIYEREGHAIHDMVFGRTDIYDWLLGRRKSHVPTQ